MQQNRFGWCWRAKGDGARLTPYFAVAKDAEDFFEYFRLNGAQYDTGVWPCWFAARQDPDMRDFPRQELDRAVGDFLRLHPGRATPDYYPMGESSREFYGIDMKESGGWDDD